MPRSALAILCVALFACGNAKDEASRGEARLARAANEPGLSVAMCGAVASYTAATRAAAGHLAIDSRAWDIAPGARVVDGDMLVRGADVCVDAELDASRRISSCVVSAATDAGWPE